MVDEGYIKFSFDLNKGELIDSSIIEDINYYRNLLHQKGFIGKKEGIGFGNISKRINNTSFIITGSKTGGIVNLKSKDYVRVVAWDYNKNYIEAIGETAPSSESLTHSIFYELDKNINVVIHIHSSIIWRKYMDIFPTSSEKVEFGTIDLVEEINRQYLYSNLKEKHILIMAGHKDGIFVFHNTFEEAYAIVSKFQNSLPY